MSPRRLPSLSFRTRILLLLLGVAVAPLAIAGLWLTGVTARSGESLLRSRLAEELEADRRAIGTRWIPYRSLLLDVAEHPAVAGMLGAAAVSAASPTSDLPELEDVLARLPPEVHAVRVVDRGGATVWRRDRSPAPSAAAFGTPLRVGLQVRDRWSGELRGRVEAYLPLQALLQDRGGRVPGGVVAAFDQSEGTLLTPVPVDPLLLEESRFRWEEGEWITATTMLGEPHLRLVAAAPLAPFVAPFREAARRGGVLLLLTAVLGMGAAVLITGRMTHSLESLVAAAEAVSRGDLEPSLEEGGDDEIGRVSHAFNQMTRSLRQTLARLADREALAAVGEFAATLAHEVRNPLTAIHLDLQQVEERLPPGSPEREIQRKVLDHVRRLNRTVTGALETARSGRGGTGAIDAREPLARAMDTAVASFDAAGARLHPPAPGPPTPVHADPDALERAFLNVLLNAAQALPPGGRAAVSVEEAAREVTIAIEDDGPGVPAELVERVFEPLMSRREGGTGLGLPVTRRIVESHGGVVELESGPGPGTRVRIRLPRAAGRGEPSPATAP